MGVLSKILPDPAVKYLQRTINPSKSQPAQVRYSDTLVILKVPQDDPASAFQLLDDFVSSLNDNCPEVLRCEVYAYSTKRANIKVHITLRFSSNYNAVNLHVDGILFKHWLEQWETKGLWTCNLYHEAMNLVAGFDRGRSRRISVGLHEPTTDMERGLDGMGKEKAASKSENLVVQVNEGLQMQEMSDVRRGKQKQ
ncbi:MAG: hypothetical protein Q9169_001334 [Polycauliona sp. 2 TL-2023]